jgi:hypothetical protein
LPVNWNGVPKAAAKIQNRPIKIFGNIQVFNLPASETLRLLSALLSLPVIRRESLVPVFFGVDVDVDFPVKYLFVVGISGRANDQLDIRLDITLA